MTIITITVEQLQYLGACERGIVDFQKLFGNQVTLNWGKEILKMLVQSNMAPFLGWAYEHKVIPDLDLSGVDLSGKDLRFIRFRNGNLKKANLLFTNFRYADLRGVNLKGAGINYQTDFSNVDFDNTIMPDGSIKTSPAYIRDNW